MNIPVNPDSKYMNPMKNNQQTGSNLLVDVNDPLYSTFQNSVPIDKDTNNKSVQILPPVAGNDASSSAASSAAVMSDVQSFSFNPASPYSRIRLDTSVLRQYFTVAKANGAAPSNVKLPWNFIAHLFNRWSISINNNHISTKNSEDEVMTDFTTKILCNLNKDVGKYMVFMPDEDECYSVPLTDATEAVFVGSEPIVDSNGGKYKIVKAADDSNGAAISTNGTNTVAYNAANKELLKSIKIKQSKSLKHRLYCVDIPLYFFIGIKGISNNIRNIQLEINNKGEALDILDKFNGANSDGKVFLKKQRIICDVYNVSSVQDFQSASTKNANVDEHFVHYDTYLNRVTLSGSQSVIINNKKNVDRAVIYNFGFGQKATIGGTVSTTLTYNPGDMYIPFSGHAEEAQADADGASTKGQLLYATQQRNTANGRTLKNVQMSIGNLNYPPQALEFTDSENRLDLTSVYEEYLKATDTFDNFTVSPLVTWEQFNKTLPFIMLKPWSNNGGKVTDSSDIMFNFTVNTTPTESTTLYISLVQLNAFTVKASGDIQKYSMV